MKYNEIRIRNVDVSAVAKIDELAKKKGMSRNEYLKKYIENLAVLGEIKDIENKYQALIKSLAEVIENNTIELEKVNAKLNEK